VSLPESPAQGGATHFPFFIQPCTVEKASQSGLAGFLLVQLPCGAPAGGGVGRGMVWRTAPSPLMLGCQGKGKRGSQGPRL
jgi:hypothetical protein